MRKALFFLVFLGVSIGSWAQDTASIVGTVKDSSGGVIAGGKVTVSNPEKGFTRDLVSNSVGEYSAQVIPIGNYVITAEVPGFQKLLRTGITVGVGQILRVDLTMAVGQTTQEVTVTAAGAKVETETAAISGVVTGTQIANLNLNGRNFVSLAVLVPGAVADDTFDPTQVGITGFASISFNGGRMEYNNWEIDGGNNLDEGSGGVSINTFPNLDSIAEFRISTSNYGAELGKHSGATIEMATKSGTKDFHGDAFEYVRNDVFDANPWDINRASIGSEAPKSPLKWNDFGYTLGGPFYIPGHYNTSKSKTFFFWSQDWRRYRQGQTVGAGVPTLLQRQGDFSECDPSSANYNSVVASGCTLPTNPVMGSLYAGDTVPIDPNAADLLNGLVPLPNTGPAGHENGYVVASSTATNWREEQIRVDQNFTDKTQVFMRWTQDAWNTLSVPALWTGSSSDTIKTPFFGPAKSTVIHFTHTFKPTLMNEFVASYSADHISLSNQTGASSPAHSIDKPSDWTVENLFSANASNPLLPSISVNGFTADAGNHPWFNSNPIVDFKDNVAWMTGKHALKFGVFYQDYHKNEQFGFDTQGFLTFSNSSPISSGNGLADMYLGRIASYEEGTINLNGTAIGGYPKGHWNGHDVEPYIEDDWKVSNKLTLNLGLRYYYFQPFHDISATNIDSAFVPSEYNPAAQAQLVNDPVLGPVLVPGTGSNYTVYGNGLYACGTHGVPKGCFFGPEKNFAPRFGFAYDPFGAGKTVIRGGYGIYYEMGNGNESNAEGGEGNPPVSLAPTAYNLVGYSSIQPINSPSAEPISPGGFTAVPLHQKWPSVQQFSLGIQHEFPGGNIMTVGYVGSLGRHLATSRNLNQIPLNGGTVSIPSLANTAGCDAEGNCDIEASLIGPGGNPGVFFAPYQGYTGITGKQNSAVSHYNSLQVSWRHDVGHGLTFQAAYTWAHAIDDSSTTYFSTGVDDNVDLSRWKATSSLNRAQVVEMSYVYELPFFKHSSSAVTRQALGGWTISGISSFYSGEPSDFGCGLTDPVSGLGYATGIGGGVRCNSLGPVKIKKGIYDDPTYGPTPTWVDPSVVGQVTLPQLRADGEPGMFGYMGRNPLTLPGVNNWNLALHKDFAMPWVNGEHSILQVRWETFNTFNRTQFGGVSIGCSGLTAPGAPCIGPNNIGNGEIGTPRPPRIMQLAMKFIF